MSKKPLPQLSVYDTAQRLAQRGYHVIALHPNTKVPVAPKDDGKAWLRYRLSPDDVPDHFKATSNLGILTGTEVAPGVFLIAIDVDQEDEVLIERVRLAIGGDPPAKRGSKGLTFFGRGTAAIKKKLFKRKDAAGKSQNCIEVLAAGQQTVLPPSIHDKTLKPYFWVTERTLLDYGPEDLPLIDEVVLSEIEAAVKKPDSNLFLLNDMVPSTKDEAGTIHDSSHRAVATMIGMGWGDEAVRNRVMRATRRADPDGERPELERAVDEWIKSAREKGYDVPTATKNNPRVAAANWLLHEWHGADTVYARDGVLMAYTNGHFKRCDLDQAHYVLGHDCPIGKGKFEEKDWTAIYKTAVGIAPRWPHVEPKRRVCLQNGTFDMDTGELTPWSKDDFLIHQLDFSYDPDADAPFYKAMVGRAFNSGNRDDQLLSVHAYEEFVAHTLFECLDYQKFMVILGVPGTGKSKLLKLIDLLHGGATSAVPVDKFGDERYQSAMIGRLVNVAGEVQVTSYAADSFLKQITAGDAIELRYLYKSPFRAVLPTRIVIGCNEMFRTRDTSGAVERRLLLLRCDNVIGDDERIEDSILHATLVSELAGIFNRLVAAWHRLRDRRRFDPPLAMREHVAEFTLDNNHVLQWFQERTWQGIHTVDPEVAMPKKLTETENGILFLDYSEWSKMNNFQPISVNTWGAKLSQIRMNGFDLSAKYKRVGGRCVRVRNLMLTQEGNY